MSSGSVLLCMDMYLLSAVHFYSAVRLALFCFSVQFYTCSSVRFAVQLYRFLHLSYTGSRVRFALFSYTGLFYSFWSSVQ
jgi:hypothetical protein